MQQTPQNYQRLVDVHQPSGHTLRNTVRAFWVGGGLCCLGGLLARWFVSCGAEKEDAALIANLCLIAAAALLTALHWFDDIGRFAGGGTFVPITGFSNAVASAAMDARTEGFFAGVTVKMFTIAGPVVVFGVIASVVYGVILML